MNHLYSFVSQFKPAIFFLLKFIGLYVVGNLVYGWYVFTWQPRPDPVTRLVTVQSAYALQLFYEEIKTRDNPARPTTSILQEGKPVVSVYEGCNGINVAIVFISFLLAYGPLSGRLLWFALLGLLIIHFINLMRIALLFAVSVHLPDALYFTHKYLFTAFIFLFVFILWGWWVFRLAKK
ncbi:MAG: hypothetical protein KatS3mg032_0018 [Cyclobacteriaceae bacterium]|nr:MAG: hypothetical protein KatS3mg032_0018 [Cyclobacteriaceae bacterium]